MISKIAKFAYLMWYMLKTIIRPGEANEFFGNIYQNVKKNLLKQVEISDLFPGIHETRVTFYKTDWEYGGVDLRELYLLSALVKQSKSQNIFEIGTFKGTTTLHLAVNSEPNTRIFTLNLPVSSMPSAESVSFDHKTKFEEEAQTGEKYRGTDVAPKIIQLYGDSAVYDFTPFYNRMDFVFVDGSHQYEFVKKDSMNAFKLLKENGLILWHDYGRAGVTKALDEISRQKTIYQIKGTSLAIFMNHSK